MNDFNGSPKGCLLLQAGVTKALRIRGRSMPRQPLDRRRELSGPGQHGGFGRGGAGLIVDRAANGDIAPGRIGHRVEM